MPKTVDELWPEEILDAEASSHREICIGLLRPGDRTISVAKQEECFVFPTTARRRGFHLLAARLSPLQQYTSRGSVCREKGGRVESGSCRRGMHARTGSGSGTWRTFRLRQTRIGQRWLEMRVEKIT